MDVTEKFKLKTKLGVVLANPSAEAQRDFS